MTGVVGCLPAKAPEGWRTTGRCAQMGACQRTMAGGKTNYGRRGSAGPTRFMSALDPTFIFQVSMRGLIEAGDFTGREAGLLLWAARQRRPYRGDVRPLPGLLPEEKGNGSAGGGTGWMTGVVEGLPAKAPEDGRTTGRCARTRACQRTKGWWMLGAPAGWQSARQRTVSPRHVAGCGARFQEAVKGSQGRDEGKDQ